MPRVLSKISLVAILLFPLLPLAGTVMQTFDFCGNGDFQELVLTDKKYDGTDVFLWKLAKQTSDDQYISTSKKRLPIVAYQSKENPKILFAEWDPRHGFGPFYSLNEQGGLCVCSFSDLQKKDALSLKKLKIPKTKGFLEFRVKAISFLKNCAIGATRYGNNFELCLFTNSNDGEEKPNVCDFLSFPQNSKNVRGVISSKKEDFIGIVFCSDFEKIEGNGLSQNIFNEDLFTEILTEIFGENKIKNGDKISVLWFKIDAEGRNIFPVNDLEN